MNGPSLGRARTAAAAAIWVACAHQPEAVGVDDMALIRARIRSVRRYDGHSAGLSNEALLELIRFDGSFSDLSNDPQPRVSQSRILQLALAYRDGKPGDVDRRVLLKKLTRALRYWSEHPEPYEWPWVPFNGLRRIALAECIIFDDVADSHDGELKRDLAQIAARLARYSHCCWLRGRPRADDEFPPTDGQHSGGNVGYRLLGMTGIAACSGDPKEMDWVARKVRQQFRIVVNREDYYPVGLTPDGSSHQHNKGGAQFYWKGYGGSWVFLLLDHAEHVKGTRWEPPEAYDYIARSCLDGMQWVSWFGSEAGAIPYNIAGRHTYRRNYPRGLLGASHIDRLLALSDGKLGQAAELRRLRDRLERREPMDGTKYFWNSDLMIHKRRGFCVTVKMVSKRTIGTETLSGIGQHTKNYYSGDGTAFILRTGREFDNARVGWNWRALPGITAEQKTDALPNYDADWASGHLHRRSLNSYAGGLTDGRLGLCAFDYHRAHDYVRVRARKAYFFHEFGFTALGAAVRTADGRPGAPVWTTVNQVEWKGDIASRIEGIRGVVPFGRQTRGDHTLTVPAWFHHDGIGYVVFPAPGGSRLRLWAETRTGDWNEIRGSGEPDTQDVPMFQLSLDHGTLPESGSYHYLVVPGTTADQLDALTQDCPSEFLRNDGTVQAARDRDTGTVLAAFYEEGDLDTGAGLRLTADGPAVLMIRPDGRDLQLSVADPTQKREAAELTFDRRFEMDGVVTWDEGSGRSRMRIEFPSGHRVGSAQRVTVRGVRRRAAAKGTERPGKQRTAREYLEILRADSGEN